MAEENLLSAARRAVRDFNITMNRGGLITVDTEKAMATLNLQVENAIAQLKTGEPVVITPEASGYGGTA